MLQSIREPVGIVSTFREEEYRFTPEQPYRLFAVRYDENRSVCLHYHDALEVLVNRGVRGFTTVAGTRYDLARTRAIVVPPNVTHGHDMRAARGSVLVFQLSLVALASFLDLERLLQLAGKGGLQEAPFVAPGYRELADILDDLSLAEAKDFFDRIGLLVRVCKVIAAHAGTRRSARGAERFLSAAISWTEEHLSERVTLAEVASHCGLSRYHFCRLFRRATGTHYSDYLNQVRLDHAKAMLLRGASVTDAALGSGYQNVSYFVQVFRKATGATPGVSRRSAR
jgi:AraC-like DNA-binding protein